MSLVERYLNITNISPNDFVGLFDEELCDNIIGYQYNFKLSRKF